MSHKGINITEVWDYRLSTAVPQIVRRKTWMVEIWAKSNPDYDPAKPETLAKPLAVFDTKITTEDNDQQDCKKVAACYDWLRSVRDEYSLDDIEDRKPIVAEINAANQKLAELGRKA